jgi:hypothetical protein
MIKLFNRRVLTAILLIGGATVLQGCVYSPYGYGYGYPGYGYSYPGYTYPGYRYPGYAYPAYSGYGGVAVAGGGAGYGSAYPGGYSEGH